MGVFRGTSISDRLLFVTIWVSMSLLANAVSEFPVILVISMDAFRPDYIEDCLTPNIARLRASGTYAPFLKNVFPTKTFPNHHSIATGVHPDVHGVLDSSVYICQDGSSSCPNRTLVHYGYQLYHYDNDILPIWTLNQLAGKGRHSGVMMWPGGEFPYGCKKTMPTFSQKWNVNVSYEERISTAISWITHDGTPANLVMLYLEEPDLHGHAFGINSEEVRDQIKRLDKAMGYLDEQLQKHSLEHLVTVFVVSDHGMISLSQKNIIDFNSYVDKSKYVTAGTSPVLQVFPKQGNEENVLTGLQRASQDFKNKFDVFTQNEIPSTWHYASNNRSPPILVVAREGYAFQDFYHSMDDLNIRFHIEPNPQNKYGIHGYSNSLPTMHSLFFAWGPLVKSGVVLDPFNTTELYPLWAHVLNLEPEHPVYSSANFSMLRLNPVAPVQTPSDKLFTPLNRTSHPYLPSSRHHVPGSAPAWTYWFSGLIALSILVVITGIVVYFYRSFSSRYTKGPVIPQHTRSSVENQHLLVSESEDEFKL